MDALHNGYVIGVPVKANVKDIRLLEVDAPDPFREFQMMTLFRGELLPIGYIITYGSEYSILFDPRPFIWHSSDVLIGRKLVRLIKFQGGSVNEQITRLLDDCLAPEQLAS
ncbi:hypothetical protein QGP82_21400 [Leptothoe sp. LEGE 181152]|nr:hypothetical protein [Leptothoe sp. LEGE 181152]